MPKEYVGSLGPPDVLPTEFASAVSDLETALGVPVWMLVQRAEGAHLDHNIARLFLAARDEITQSSPVALLIDSPGGYADVAYKVSRLFQRGGASFIAVIPRYAKSAATLLALGADIAIMGDDAEIGPLDAQLWDGEREEPGSALDEVQALEQLHEVAREQLDQTMMLMTVNMPKRSDVLLPHAIHFVNEMMRPLLEKVDTVHYAKQARILRIAEEYARRLMAGRRPEEQAHSVAAELVNSFPEHGFVIDRDETRARGFLPVMDPDDQVRDAVVRIERYLWTHQILAFGRLQEKP